LPVRLPLGIKRKRTARPTGLSKNRAASDRLALPPSGLAIPSTDQPHVGASGPDSDPRAQSTLRAAALYVEYQQPVPCASGLGIFFRGAAVFFRGLPGAPGLFNFQVRAELAVEGHGGGQTRSVCGISL